MINTANISKYVQINDFLLLEYTFNRDNETTDLSDAFVIDTELGTKSFYESINAIGLTNNAIILNSVPINSQRTSWYLDTQDPEQTYQDYWTDTSINISGSYPCDIVKVHIISGYNFDDVDGFLLQVRADSSINGIVDLANFTYNKQLSSSLIGEVIKFAPNTLFLGNRFYDKYIEFKVPSIQALGLNDPATLLGDELAINNLSDVYLTYSTIFDINVNNDYVLDEITNIRLPVVGVADSFNCFIAESENGDYIEYYAKWNDSIIGESINQIENGRIQLYTSNNPNDNAQQFTEQFGMNARKWVVIHEITVIEQIPPSTSLISQKYSFTQDNNFSQANFFRPILPNADISSSYTIQYTCRLMNRMEGTQIIRKASFSSQNPKKYGLRFDRINVDNLIPYKVFNRIEAEKPNIIVGSSLEKTKYIKVFFNTVTVVMNAFNEVFPQGTGPIFLKDFNSVYKFKFERIDVNNQRINVDLSGTFDYALQFKIDDGTRIEIKPTYSTNMNTVLGEVEFNILESQVDILKTQQNNNYSIIVKNPNGTSYTFYEGLYYKQINQTAVLENYRNIFNLSSLQKKIAELETEIERLTDENTALNQI